MTCSFHSKLRSTLNKGVSFSFYLDKVKVFSDDSNQTNLFDVKVCIKKVNQLYVCETVYTVLKKVFLLFYITLSKCFIHSKVKASQIPLSVITPMAPTENYVFAISLSIRLEIGAFLSSYFLPTVNPAYLLDSHYYCICLLNKYFRLQHLLINGYLKFIKYLAHSFC